MIKKEKIVALANGFLEGTDRFVVEVNTNAENRILVFIDSDSGVFIEHCIALSKYIESQLDRETEDFELNVSSSGVGQPFTMLRQYQKYIGKAVQIKLTDGTQMKGLLKSATEAQIEIFDQAKNKNKKSKKIEPGELFTLPMDSIVEAKGIVTF
ncbi:MAG: ribosome assembly cofactor RimP [Bacteroidales bacterium]|jgi:ribosome maturation factor RimP|nr:ribosome assembly cofactor RimP [Bacteroidales bacterium]